MKWAKPWGALDPTEETEQRSQSAQPARRANDLSGRLKANYLVKMQDVTICQMHQATWGNYVNVMTIDSHQLHASVV